MGRPDRRAPRPSTRGPGRKPASKRDDSKSATAHLSDDVVKELHATARPGKAEILVKVFAEAVAAYMSEDYAKAIELGEQAKHMALRALAARELLGLAYYRAERWQEAVRELSAFRRLSGSSEQNPVLADAYRALGKPDRAIELTREIDPREVEEATVYEGAIVAAGALADEGRIDEAVARLEELELQPPVAAEHHLRAWYLLGHLLEQKGRFTQARGWFDAVAASDPDLTDAPERARKLARRS